MIDMTSRKLKLAMTKMEVQTSKWTRKKKFFYLEKFVAWAKAKREEIKDDPNRTDEEKENLAFIPQLKAETSVGRVQRYAIFNGFRLPWVQRGGKPSPSRWTSKRRRSSTSTRSFDKRTKGGKAYDTV